MRCAVLLVLILSRCGMAFCQQPYLFQHITPEDGLFANSNINVYEDKEGYYWFSSVQGLQRYDGRGLVTYHYLYKLRRDFSDNIAVRPTEDREGNIWVWNGEGIYILNKKKARLERLYLEDASDSNVSNVCNVLKAKDERLWIVTSRNIFVYNDSLRRPVLLCPGAGDAMHAVYDRQRNGIWIILASEPHAFVFFDCASRHLTCPGDMSLDRLFGYFNPLSLLKFDRNNYLWIADYLGDLC